MRNFPILKISGTTTDGYTVLIPKFKKKMVLCVALRNASARGTCSLLKIITQNHSNLFISSITPCNSIF